jgi:hypothetical protein
VKLKLNLSLTAKPAQRCAPPGDTENPFVNTRPTPTTACTARKNSPFALLTTQTSKPVRIPTPMIVVRPVFRGNKSYLRALRAAELAIWNANVKFPTVVAIWFAVLPGVSI